MEAKQPLIWAIRYSQRAIQDISAAWMHFAESADVDIADAWERGLKAEIAKMAQFPRRFSEADSGLFSFPVRRMTYRRTPRGPAYFLYFSLRVNPSDAPTLFIMHLRHAAQAPLTQKEAREIEASE